jgi:hypothetical protein
MLIDKLNEAKELLGNTSKYPAPPEVTVVVERDPNWISQKLEPLQINWLQLDRKYYLTDQSNFLNIVAWDWTDSYDYIRERFDCDKFAIMFKSRVNKRFLLNQVGVVLDYGSGHAYNLIIYPDGNIMLLEPQNDVIFCWTRRIKVIYPLTEAYVLL